jgi:hypothetical protein
MDLKVLAAKNKMTIKELVIQAIVEKYKELKK